MSADYRIRSVVGENEWSGQYGTFIDYEVFVEGADAPNATVTLTQKRETARPQEGQVIHGHIEEGGRGPKLKKDQQPSPSSQTSMNGGGDGPDEAYWAARQATIQRQHSQEMALRFLTAAGDLNELPIDNESVMQEYLNGPLRRLIDWFDRDASAAPSRDLDSTIKF